MSPKVFIPFSQYVPDGGRLGNPGLLDVANAAPLYQSGFVPLSTVRAPLNNIGGQFPLLDAGTAQVNVQKYAMAGGHMFRKSDRSGFVILDAGLSGIAGQESRVFVYATEVQADGTVGSTTALYSGSLGSSTPSVQAEGWFFVSYGDSVVAVAGYDMVPQLSPDAGALDAFENLFSASPAEPNAKFVAVMGLHLLLANLKEDSTVYPNRVRWSQTDNVRFFSNAVDDPERRTGYQDLNDEYGPITGIIGGNDHAMIAKEGCWYRMDQGGPFDYTFRPFGIGMGTIYPHSICKLGDTIFYWAPCGPCRIRPGLEPEPLGDGVFQRSLKDDSWVLEPGVGIYPGLPPHRLVAAVDEENELVVWGYNSQNALDEDVDWLWWMDTAFLFNARHGRAAILRNWFDSDQMAETGDESGFQMDEAADIGRIDPDGTYPADWRPCWPLFVPVNANLDGFRRWAPMLRIWWCCITKGFEIQPGGGMNPWRNTVGWSWAYGDLTSAPAARFTTDFQRLAPEGGDVKVTGVLPFYSSNVGGTAPQVEVTVRSLRTPSGQPLEIQGGEGTRKVPNDRGQFRFSQIPLAPLHQIEVLIKNPIAVGEIEGIEVEWEYGGKQ